MKNTDIQVVHALQVSGFVSFSGVNKPENISVAIYKCYIFINMVFQTKYIQYLCQYGITEFADTPLLLWNEKNLDSGLGSNMPSGHHGFVRNYSNIYIPELCVIQ